MDEYDVYVSKDSFKFTASHFIAFKGFRERLHGHNYTVAVRMKGKRTNADGYVLDFGHIKKMVNELCKQLNQRVIIPVKSDVLMIAEGSHGNVEVTCEDGSFFSFPQEDSILLPLVHSSAEELAEYLLTQCVEGFAKNFSENYLKEERGVTTIMFSVSEAPNQTATCTRNL